MHPAILAYRELYYPSPGPGLAPWLTPAYLGAGLARAEIVNVSADSDAYYQWRIRWSADNGRTWSPFEAIEDAVRETPDGGMVIYPSHPVYNPVDGHSYRFFLMSIWPGNPCYTFDWEHGNHPLVDHVFVSEDGGPARLLRYEEGADFTPDSPFDPAFLYTNKSYLGNAPAFAADGTVFFPVCLLAPGGSGMYLFRRDPASGEWLPSNHVDTNLSRELMEPESAILRDGRILTVCRGCETETTPGRKWRILSDDGGKTLGPVEEFRYDDGSSFYSPSSIHRFLRSSRNGKLYWFANIVPDPPSGNYPRYPLYIAEIDEELAAVKKDSLILLDNRQPGEPAAMHLSNFNVLENRETGNIELYMTLLGVDPDDFWHSDVCRYVFSPPAAGRV